MVIPVYAPVSGVVNAIDTRAIGICVVSLGGGRLRPQDVIDPSVGLSQLVLLGEHVEAGQPLARVHASNPFKAEQAAKAVLAAYEITEHAQSASPLIVQLFLEAS